MYHLVLDIGGSWLKGAMVDGDIPEESLLAWMRGGDHLRRVPTPVEPGLLVEALLSLAGDCAGGRKISSVVISTAGVVHPNGKYVVRCAEHLRFLRTPRWTDQLGAALGCPVTLINDAEAFVLGAAVLNYVPRLGTLCCLVVGTGLGCALTKDGRLWRPQRTHPLMGSIRIGGGQSYDRLVSASRLAENDPQGNLARCLQAPEFKSERDEYFGNLASVATTAAILHGADHLLIGGGLCDAAASVQFDLQAEVQKHWTARPPELDSWPGLQVANEGNMVLLIGAAALAAGISGQPPRDENENYSTLLTERVDPAAEELQLRTPREIMGVLCHSENLAGKQLVNALDELSEVAEHAIERWQEGGRIIYVGAGTSGRVAAMDAVEIPCTFGCSADRVVAIVAGGLSEACLSIEQDGEEDACGAPDLILLRVGRNDTVIGVSASGTSAFVKTALSYAKRQGATTVMLRAGEGKISSDWDWTISLNSGVEIVAGSTRMKAGTATKKALNFLTTTILAKCGKLRGPYMIDMECLNVKLQARAQSILQKLFSLSAFEAEDLLVRNEYKLKKAIDEAEQLTLPG